MIWKSSFTRNRIRCGFKHARAVHNETHCFINDWTVQSSVKRTIGTINTVWANGNASKANVWTNHKETLSQHGQNQETVANCQKPLPNHELHFFMRKKMKIEEPSYDFQNFSRKFSRNTKQLHQHVAFFMEIMDQTRAKPNSTYRERIEQKKVHT